MKKRTKRKAYFSHRNGDKLRKMQQSTQSNIEAYLGKKALYDTYESMKIHNGYTHSLIHRVHSKRVQLQNRGAI